MAQETQEAIKKISAQAVSFIDSFVTLLDNESLKWGEQAFSEFLTEQSKSKEDIANEIKANFAVYFDTYNFHTKAFTPAVTMENELQTKIESLVGGDGNVADYAPLNKSYDDLVTASNAEIIEPEPEGEPEANTTELSVSPESITFKTGETQKLTITTNALDFDIESSNPQVVSVNKIKKEAKGTGKGDARITISAQVAGGQKITKEIICKVTQSLDISFGDDGEILENTYHYDETLPLSINGTIAYKKGDNDHDPLIKLVFDGKLQRWQVIGVKITKFNKENEPYALYFMASEGAVANSLGNMKLEKVIVDLIDELFQQEVPNMTQTIKNLFNTTISPLIEAEMNKIPQYVRNEITTEIDAIIDEKIENTLADKFDELMRAETEKKIKEFTFSNIEPYHKTDDIPKWVGVIISNFRPAGKSYGHHDYSRRLNTNGIEEEWLDLEAERVNDCSNDDVLTKLFDKVEPFKSMERMEMLYSDLKNIAGDSIYGKEMFERLMSQSQDRNNKLWNGKFFTRGNETDVSGRESAWFVPLKKCHYIDIEFSLVGDDDNRYMLKAVGENEFTINLKDYFPNAVGIKTYYAKCPKAGYREFRTNELEITSNVHPAFLNYYDTRNNILETPLELDYVYTGAFFDVKANNSETWTAGNLGWHLTSRPFLNTYVNGEYMKNLVTKYAKNMWGMNPSVGVNFKHIEHSYMHLVWLLQCIERGNDLISERKCALLGYKYKWFAKVYTELTLKTGHTWELGNQTGVVNFGQTSYNYRGIENMIQSFYHYLGGINQQNGTKDIWLHLPHSHRFVEDLFAYDGNNWVKTDYTHRNLSTAVSGSNYDASVHKHIKAGMLGCFEDRGGRLARHYCYSHNNNVNEDRQILFFGCTNDISGDGNGRSVGLSSHWDASSGLYWRNAFRSCI